MAKPGYVYFIRPVGAQGPVKIGYSTTPFARVMAMRPSSPLVLELAAQIEGPPDLERRFHARFADSLSHNEWFLPSGPLSEAITAIQHGRFDVTFLPAPRDLRRKGGSHGDAARAGSNSKKLDRLRQSGLPIPAHVQAANRTYQVEPGEKARRRAVVEEFVKAHWPPSAEFRRLRAA